MSPSLTFHILSVINCPFYFVVLLLIHVFVIEFTEQYKWFGLSSKVHSCLFLVCATDVYCYFTFRPSSIKSSTVICYNINKLTYMYLLSFANSVCN